MNESPTVTNSVSEKPQDNAEASSVEYLPAKELEKLPPETRDVVSVIAGFFRSTSGPDPETAKIVAQTEMHQESCKLEAYKESLKNRDKQGERDHEFRKKRLNHETAKGLIFTTVCVAGIITGLYLLVVEKNSNVGTPLLVASFMALVGGKSLFAKEKD